MEADNLTFLELLLGEMTLSQWFYLILLQWMGVTLFILFRVKNRKDKETKPSFFKYFTYYDNRVHLYATFILTYVLIRFYSDYQEEFAKALPEWLEVGTYLSMFLVGYYQHKLIEYISKKR